jgi:hypothetical protein
MPVSPERRVELTFLALVCLQTLHSLEEYRGRLYDVFPPARLVSGLFSADLRRGFVTANVLLVAFGFWSVWWPVRHRWPSRDAFVGVWIVVETINGIVHPAWSLLNGGYTPGVVTAPLLLVTALLLARAVRVEAAQVRTDATC